MLNLEDYIDRWDDWMDEHPAPALTLFFGASPFWPSSSAHHATCATVRKVSISVWADTARAATREPL
jgi:hypothetical protein